MEAGERHAVRHPHAPRTDRTVRDKRMMTLRKGGGRVDDGWGWPALVSAGQHACRLPLPTSSCVYGLDKNVSEAAPGRKQRTRIVSDTGVQQNRRPIRPKVSTLVSGGKFIIAHLRACLVSKILQNFSRFSVTSNLWTHV
jgi:hypothetical protein